MSNEQFSSVWDAIEKTPEEAENMKVRSALMRASIDRIRAEGWSQAEAAMHLGITRSRVSALLRGRIERFSIDALASMMNTAKR